MADQLVGILALQGAFREHGRVMRNLGFQTREIRQLKDIDGITAMIVPGGESTTIGKLLNDLQLLEPLRKRIAGGMPVYGTCAGLILLANNIRDSQQVKLGGLEITVLRNAFGRQVDSFETMLPVKGIEGGDYPAIFIRAPLITDYGPQVDILAEVEHDGRTLPVAVRQNNILATSFHPELSSDTRIHEYFAGMFK